MNTGLGFDVSSESDFFQTEVPVFIAVVWRDNRLLYDLTFFTLFVSILQHSINTWSTFFQLIVDTTVKL